MEHTFLDAPDPGYSDTDYESGNDDTPTSGDDYVCNESTDDDIGGPSSRSSRRSKGSRSNTNSPVCDSPVRARRRMTKSEFDSIPDFSSDSDIFFFFPMFMCTIKLCTF